jgi:GTP cyclohydrolase I
MFSPSNLKKAEKAISDFLNAFGLEMKDQHLVDTPRRVAKAWQQAFLSGYRMSAKKILSVEFSDSYDQMVVVKNIPFCSLCSHHLVPFLGEVKVGYIPKEGRITGLSKLARIVEMYSRRLQIQERMTQQIARAIEKHLKPVGVGVIVEAEHLCMTIRGVEKPGSITVTSCLLGCFRDEAETRAEFLNF